MRNDIFRNVRYALYFAIIVNGILIQWFVPFIYKCNIQNETCMACGLRKAIDLLIKGQFYKSYQSNKLIIVVVIIILIMLIDVALYLLGKLKYK